MMRVTSSNHCGYGENRHGVTGQEPPFAANGLPFVLNQVFLKVPSGAKPRGRALRKAERSPRFGISALTHATAEAVDAPVDSIRVVIREVPTTHWAAGDVTIAERRGAPDPRTDPDPDSRG